MLKIVDEQYHVDTVVAVTGLITNLAEKKRQKTAHKLTQAEFLRQEMTKYKEARQARSFLITAVHQHILAAVGDYMNVDDSYIMDGVLDRMFQIDLLVDFVKKGGRKVVMFISNELPAPELETGRINLLLPPYATMNRFVVTDGSEFNIDGSFVAAYRMDNDTSIELKNVCDIVCFLTMQVPKDMPALSAFYNAMSNIHQPYLHTLGDWGTLSTVPPGHSGFKAKEDLLINIDQFVHFLNMTSIDIDGRIRFEMDNVLYTGRLLEVFQVKASAADYEIMITVRDWVKKWYKQILLVATQSNQIRREDPNCGPSAELEYWRRILSKYESIIEFINSKQCKNHLLCATIARCKIMKKWRIMDNQITDVCNEATDNVKYLTSLQSYLDPLYRYDPVKLLTALPPLLFTVRMIATSSRYFNTSNKLTSLLGKVTNQLINRCNMYLTNNYETNIWLLPKKVLLGRIKDCCTLYETYLSQYNKTLQDMEDSPKEKPFFCSPTSLFGRFKVFLDRLNKIADVLTTTNKFSVLQHSTVEGIAVYAKNFADLFLTVASKTYDPLAHRKPDFDVDYEIFKNGIAEQSLALKQFVGESLLPINNTENAIILLNRFKKLNLNCLRIETKYMEVMQSTFLTEIEELRDSYNEMRTNPPIPRNAPPVSGRIMWVRNLYQRMELPMEQLKKIRCVIQHKRARKCIKLYNCLAGIFIHYEIIYHQAWCSHVVQVRHGLSSPILLRDPTTDMLQVNMHPYIMEAIYESECMLRLGLAIPDLMQVLLFCKETLQQNVAILQRLIDRNNQVRCAIPKLFIPLLRINLNKLDTAWAPGLATVSWSSTKIPAFCETVTTAMDTLTTFVKSLVDIKEARIDHVFDYLLHTCLVYMPDEPLSPDDFKQANIDYRTELQQELNIKVSAAETATIQLINAFIFTGDMEESDLNYDWMDLERLAKPVTSATALATDYIEFKPIDDDHIRNDLKSMHADCIELFAYFNNKMTDTLVKMTRHSLELFKERSYSNNPTNFENKPLMLTNMELQIPIAIINPTLDTCQAAFSEVVMNILAFFSHIETWGYKVKVKRLPDGTLPGGKYLESSYKNYYRTMSEHKDVLKGLLELQAIVLEVKPDLDLLLDTFKQYAPLWDETREDQIVKFVTEPHLVADIREMFKGYNDRGQMLEDLPNLHQLGCLQINMEKIKLALIVESNAWKNILGRHLSAKNRKVLTEMVSFIQDKDKILSKPLQDLDDVRIAMVGLEAVRENFISLDMALALMEETYALFADFKVPILSDDNNKIYSLRYKFDSLLAKTKTVQEDICSLQDKLQEELETGMSGFLQDVQNFVKDYEDNGPMVPGIAAREASDRVMIFQSRFDELWRRYEMYASGEKLFGLTLTEYPSLEEKQKEFNLLNKLYSLYLLVIKSIDGYYDLRWTDVDTEVIITELTDLQNKCRRLPKAMTNWPAYKDLKKKIDDFNETCPLLELMANKAMKERHWKRLEELTGCSFDVDSASFTLKNVMEAPLLKYKDDVEDICIGAIKERDIDVKLKQVIADWSVIEVTFANFKARGELLLKGADVTEIITLLEDSLMVLNSLLSNRYNAPLKKDIQLWVWKLVTSGEILEKWLMVQSIWVYLEAVFVGGDIAVQLPAEAKRFSTIDKTWVKIMYRARDNPNCVECCVGDDTMINLLPFLLEQLETCQKSLTGYLEQKRLCFPRFFFISDPVMLEILGQASDPQSIKPHLLSIFDAVASIDFDEKHPDTIVALLSAMEERVPLENPVLCRGGVEVWLGALLAGMKESLKGILSGLATLLQEPDFDFIASFVDYCGQAGLLGVQLLWTTESEQAINTSRIDRTVMKCQNQRFLDLLNSLIELTVLDLTRIQRICYETMVTIHVHQRDIFDDMVRLHIRTTQDFEWQKQSRFYFIEDTDDVIVKITDVDFLYQNEYLGVTERLAVTPLTDRCYVTLAQSIGMYMGGAPAGPAGTGKTETTKDMGRALGKLVVVFNCSDQMDFRGLGRIYKGLAQSGSWGCFDEFNRIELPVLSVAAQQIYIVLTAKKEHKKAFLFSDGDTVSLDPEFGLFITMNPGYAGRQELPENLKIQFRTVAMMVPDRQIIIRVKLASCGFKDNVPLSRKFFTLYKLCEEQLSKQVHYDFGLRNILSVLRTLGAQKRANPKDSEETTLMRVLKDMNVSKLIDEDEPLFLSLIDDMFPGMKLTRAVWKDLQGAITNQSAAMGVMNHDEWNLKIVQLYETSLVRHGLMILGPTGSGKTACIHCLQRSFTELGKTTKEMRMNPKAITASQMFGRLDVATNDWTDGIFSTLWRRSLKMKKTEFCWLVLDGPVDAVWIENLNSVLDDNKTLTLANGDRITMSPNCKLVFEPDNVDNASPATVSRMGMVFISSSVLQWTPILQGWLKKRPSGQAETLLKFFSKIYDDLHAFVQAKVKAKMAILEAIYIRQCCDLLMGLLDQHVNEDEEAPPAKSYSERHLEKLFLFAVMWSLGAVLELDDRQQFQEYAMKKCAKMSWPKLLTDESIFEYVVDDTGAWQHWNDRIEEFIYPEDSVLEYSKILVPNVDNVRTAFLIHIIAKQRKAVLLIGEQGTAKTVMLKSYMSNYDPEYQLFKSFNFSSATTPNMFQRIVESYVDKRVGTTYGPPNQKKMTIFIDDINMPIVNEWGDQVTNEIVRQLMANSGFYSLDKPGDFSTILDVQLVAAMIHPGGGRNDIPPRLKRQFNIFNCALPSTKSMDLIFSKIGEGYFCSTRFNETIVEFVPQLIALTRILWQQTKIKMLPTPAKFHYVFNLRDLSRIWQGILTIQRAECKSVNTLLKLWKHECIRVIADRFTNFDDRIWFIEDMRKTAQTFLGNAFKDYPQDETYFVDFLREPPDVTGDEPDDFDYDAPKIYEEIPSVEFVLSKVFTFMGLYNENVRGASMDLVFFHDAMVHLFIISRIVRMPRGNALLVGVGGSGKQSLTKLATFIANYQSFQITMTRAYNFNNLQDDLKILYRIAGHQGKGITFLFTDNDIKEEGFLEFINNVLSSGEIANLFPKDELDEITSELINPMKKFDNKRIPTFDNLYDFFISRARNNLHVALCFSPVGEKFRNRSLKFPGLISGCTVDWFQRWPKDALVAVSNHFLEEFEVVATPNVKYQLIRIMGEVQDYVADLCVQYYERFRRQAHVTPKSFLSFLVGYKDIYKVKHENIAIMAERMKTGLIKLVEAGESVAVLRKELEIKDKGIRIASAAAEVVLVSVTKLATAAEAVKLEVLAVKDKAIELVAFIAKDTAVAETKLAAARPALAAAEAALQTIKAADIATVRKLGKPPYLITLIMDAVIILFKKRLEPVRPDMERKFLESSWADSLKLMADTRFLAKLIEYPKDSINGEIVDLLKPYLTYELYTFQNAKSACGNVAGLIQWTMSMATFYGINKEVLPLKLNLASLQNKYDKAKEELDAAEALLKEKEDELAVVQAKFDKAMSLKQAVLDDAAICQAKMDAAVALIDGLAGERIRWTEQSAMFASEIERLIGDVLILTGFLSYAGPFNQEFRTMMQASWVEELLDRKMPVTMNLSILESLTDTATIGEWNLQGLPTDDLSIQNGIIVTKAARFPLLIDPQGQGKAWINNLEKDNQILVTTLNHKYFRNHIEDAISLGLPILIEDVAEELDPALDNVLERNYIKMGNTYKVKLGDKEVDVTEGFRVYITTKLPNPAYTPEISARTSIIDFTVTMQGLEDQLLGRVILTEKKELETERTALIQDVTNNRRKMKQLEANLLHKLTTTQGSLVDDVTVIGVLNVTKATANEVSNKLDIARDTELKINTAREEFRPVATRGSVLYFLIVNVSLVNCMYQTALSQFLERFDLSMSDSPKSPITTRRIKSIISYLTYDIFQYTCRGLYENHKYMFALMMTLRIDIQRNIITHYEFGNFIKGGAALDLNACPNKPFFWITDMTWLNLVQLSTLRHFQYILTQVEHNERSWKSWFATDEPEDEIIPDGYQYNLDVFRRLLLVRAWCPDRTLAQSRKYVSWSLGPDFAEPVVLDFDSMHLESKPLVPLICFLSMGSDPTPTIEALAKKIAKDQEKEDLKVEAISMGQGQEVHARKLVATCMEVGQWALLQNCHLGLDYMTELLLLLQDIEKTDCVVVHEDFRVWMTTEVHPDFPISLLQMSLKFTNEPPSGIKAGLKRTYASMNQDWLDYSESPQYLPLIFAVSFLHTVVQERRKFGPLGWNIPYEFNSSDWLASCYFVQNHLEYIDPKKGVSWSTVRYMLGEVQYGGRVTDDYDKRLLTTLCKVWFLEKMFDDSFQFYKGYKILKYKSIPDYLLEIDTMNNVDPPQAYGLHFNADITYQSNSTAEMLETILSIQPKESGGGAGETREVVVSRLVKEMQAKLPPDFDPFEVKARLMKLGSTSSMNIFLRQEIDRMQKVITLVRQTLKDLLLAIEGTIIMNEALGDALDNIYDARIPNSWKRGSWVSSTLGFWFTELLERCTQFNTWCFKGRPPLFWMTGFFNPQGFLTAMRQEVARAHKGWALDAVTMHNEVTKYSKEDVNNPPNEGVYVYGLYMDGASYDKKSNRMCESTNKVLFTLMPVVHVYAINSTAPKNPKLYECPVYKKPQRTDLTFITPFWLNTMKPPDHWTMRGVALLCDIK